MNKVIFTPCPGSLGWKNVLLNFGISPNIDESKIFDYLPYDVTWEQGIKVLQLFFVPSFVKDEIPLVLNFENVKCIVVVFDEAKEESLADLKKIVKDVKSKMICPFQFIALGCRVNDVDINSNIMDFLYGENLRYCRYSHDTAHLDHQVFCELLVAKIKELTIH